MPNTRSHALWGSLRQRHTATPSSAARGIVVLSAAAGLAVVISFSFGGGTARAQENHLQTEPGKSVSGNVWGGNAGYSKTVASVVQPKNGSLTISPNGDYTYTPATGFTGDDSFTITGTTAAQLFKTDLPPLASFGGVDIKAGGYGSAVVAVPGKPGYVYGLTDRGPNVDGPAKNVKVEPTPQFTPAIAEFQLVDGKAIRVRDIPLKSTDGSPLNGLVNPGASTSETIQDLNGVVQPTSKNGLDSEGLVAMADGTFYVSDEYGPFIVHFDADGKELGRISPFPEYPGLPAELSQRTPNQGMEGLTITPDGKTLVGIMQSALAQKDLPKGVSAKKVAPSRLVTIDLDTKVVKEFLVPLENPGQTKDAFSEITALDAETFLVDERDGAMGPAARKLIYKVSIKDATDVGPSSPLLKAKAAGFTYDGVKGGLLIDGKTVEATVGEAATSDALKTLAEKGITASSKDLALDLGKFVYAVDSAGGFFGHDKIEGIYPLPGNRLLVSNDNDFGLAGLKDGSVTPPYALDPKILPNGQQDDGEYLIVDLNQVNPDGSLKTPLTTQTMRVTVAASPVESPTTSPSTTPATSSPTVATASSSAPGTEAPVASDPLAQTGVNLAWFAVGAGAILAGTAALMIARRRRVH